MLKTKLIIKKIEKEGMKVKFLKEFKKINYNEKNAPLIFDFLYNWIINPENQKKLNKTAKNELETILKYFIDDYDLEKLEKITKIFKVQPYKKYLFFKEKDILEILKDNDERFKKYFEMKEILKSLKIESQGVSDVTKSKRLLTSALKSLKELLYNTDLDKVNKNDLYARSIKKTKDIISDYKEYGYAFSKEKILTNIQTAIIELAIASKDLSLKFEKAFIFDSYLSYLFKIQNYIEKNNDELIKILKIHLQKKLSELGLKKESEKFFELFEYAFNVSYKEIQKTLPEDSKLAIVFKEIDFKYKNLITLKKIKKN